MNEEPLITTMKVYAPVVIAALFGAIAHALEEVKKAGWKGWANFAIDITVCSFVGWVFFNMANLIDPSYAVIATSIGSYWGTKGFVYVKEWFIKSIKANIK